MAKCLRCGAGNEWLQGNVPAENKTKRENDRTALNEAAIIFRQHFCHVPILPDDHPAMPKQCRKFRADVTAAIADGVKAGRAGR